MTGKKYKTIFYYKYDNHNETYICKSRLHVHAYQNKALIKLVKIIDQKQRSKNIG